MLANKLVVQQNPKQSYEAKSGKCGRTFIMINIPETNKWTTLPTGLVLIVITLQK